MLVIRTIAVYLAYVFYRKVNKESLRSNGFYSPSGIALSICSISARIFHAEPESMAGVVRTRVTSKRNQHWRMEEIRTYLSRTLIIVQLNRGRRPRKIGSGTRLKLSAESVVDM